MTTTTFIRPDVKPIRVTCPQCSYKFDTAKSGKPRSPEQHARFFAVVHAAYHHWPEAHETQFGTAEACRYWITMKAGYREVAYRGVIAGVKLNTAKFIAQIVIGAAKANSVVTVHKNELVIWSPKSIKFASMGHLEFNALNTAVDEVILAELGMTSDELITQHKRSA
jgi:hypothetical protein